MEKTEYYKRKGGKDLIDRWAEEHSPELFRAIVASQIEKYISRIGKKPGVTILSDVKKIFDYARRWQGYEIDLIDKGVESEKGQ